MSRFRTATEARAWALPRVQARWGKTAQIRTRRLAAKQGGGWHAEVVVDRVIRGPADLPENGGHGGKPAVAVREVFVQGTEREAIGELVDGETLTCGLLEDWLVRASAGPYAKIQIDIRATSEAHARALFADAHPDYAIESVRKRTTDPFDVLHLFEDGTGETLLC